jgi:hypothetical protein
MIDDNTRRSSQHPVLTSETAQVSAALIFRAPQARWSAEGKSTREIRRCIKRYVARQLYRTLTAAMAPTAYPTATG